MSGQPIKYAKDIQMYRQNYMDSLNLRSSLDDVNLQANKTYKATGQLPAVSSIPDTRTTSEKFADIEKMKLTIASEMKPIADTNTALDIIQKLINDPLNVDGKLYRFFAQRVKALIANVQGGFAYGLENQNDISKFIAGVKDFYQKSQTLADTTEKYFKIGTDDFLSGLTGVGYGKVLNTMGILISELKKKSGNYNLPYELATTIYDSLAKIIDIFDSKNPGQIIADFRQMITNVEARPEVLPERIQREGHGHEQLLDIFMMSMEEMSESIKPFEDNLAPAHVLEQYANEILLLYRNKNIDGMLVPLQDMRAGILSKDQLRRFDLDLTEMVKITRMWNNALNMPTLGEPIAQMSKEERRARKAMDRAKASGAEAPPIRMGEEAEAGGEAPPLKADAGGADAGGNYTLEQQVKQKISDGGLLDIGTDTYLTEEFKQHINNLSSDAIFQGLLNGAEMYTANNVLDYALKKAKSKKASGRGLRRGRPRGKGISKPFVEKIDKSQGIISTPQYTPFGKYVINNKKIHDNILSIKTMKGTNVLGFPAHKASHHLTKVIKHIIGGGLPSYEDMSKLSEEDKHYLYKLSKKSDILDKVNIPTPSKDQQDKDNHNFEVMKGEILSGNDNKDLVKKFKILILKMSKQGDLPKSEVAELLTDLAEIGY